MWGSKPGQGENNDKNTYLGPSQGGMGNGKPAPNSHPIDFCKTKKTKKNILKLKYKI